MTGTPPRLDHVVVDVRDGMDAAVARWTALGFHMTPRGFHTLGSINHLAMFRTDYLELLGFGPSGGARADLAGFPDGLNGLVFKTADAEAAHRDATARGIAIQPARSFSRPVSLDGRTADARFRTANVTNEGAPFGRVYFCEHLTPELVWRPEWQRQPNGTTGVARIIVSAREPRRTGEFFDRLFGAALFTADPAGGLSLDMAGTVLEIAPPASLAARFGDALADPAGRGDHMAVLEVRTSSLDTAAAAAGGLGRRTGDSVLVPAAAANNVTLLFRP